MTGRSYDCPVCGAYLGRGKERARAHTLDHCRPLLERTVEGREKSLQEARENLLDFIVLEDAGIDTVRAMAELMLERRRRRLHGSNA